MFVAGSANAAIFVLIAFSVLIIVTLLLRHWIDILSEKIVYSFVAPWRNFFVRIVLWLSVPLLLISVLYVLYRLAH